MQTDPSFFFPQTEEGKQAYIKEAERVINEIKTRLPEMFGVMPKADIVVKPVELFREKTSIGSAFYQPASPDGSRPGVFYINTYDMSAMPKYTLPTFAYHEAIPGHHMQVAIAQELDKVPNFAVQPATLPMPKGGGCIPSCCPKRWGCMVISTLTLGACRLVVDTGLHDKRWSREKAINYLMDNSPTDRENAIKAIERYLVLPSQATAYKVGMLKILELRQQAKFKLDNQFDIRKFHDVVLFFNTGS